jgi:O-acetyl-ADP-ribose deacetylase (regulator of RNase III)
MKMKKIIICHVCNNIGAWGQGFALSISKKWDWVEHSYKNWHRRGLTMMDGNKNNTYVNFKLGCVQFVVINKKLIVANMIAQNGIISPTNNKQLSMEDLEICLEKCYSVAKMHGAALQMPRIGAGLAGGDWNEIEPVLRRLALFHQITTKVLHMDP